jgi:TP901 family phage tail tape measure protein
MATQPLRVKINGDASGLNGAIKSASSKLKSFGGKLKGLGSSLQSLTLPMTLIGGASVKMALDFDKSMTKIKSLVGIASDSVDEMGKTVKKLAIDTGTSSREAADALFFITSAGLRGSDALKTLEVSLKAAASGLGETETIARLNTAAMAAYGKENLSTAAATDVLVAAVKEGRLDSAQLGQAMEQVVPIASEMGVEFNELGAAFAAVSRTNSNASIAATGLRSVLVSLLSPSEQAREALEGMGLGADFIRQNIKEKGLLNTLQLLAEKFDGNADATTAVFGNIRALLPVMSLTGKNAKEVEGIFSRMENTLDMTSQAFKTTEQSASFKFQKALNGAKETLTSLGQQLLVAVVPLLQKAASFVQNLYQRFNELSPITKKLVIALGGVVIALPTIISLAGTLTGILGALLSPIGLVAAGLAGIAYVISQNWNEILPVVVGLYNQFVDLYNSSGLLRLAIGAIGAVFKTVFIAAKASVMKFVNVFKTMWKLIKAFSKDGFDASFGDILKEGFIESKKITSDAGEELATELTDSFANSVGNQLEKKTVEQVQKGINNAVAKSKSIINNAVNSMFSGGGGGGGSDSTESGLAQGMTQINQPSALSQLVTLPDIILGTPEGYNEKFDAFATKMQELGLNIETIMSEVGNSFMSAFSAMMEGKNFVKALGQMLGQIIKQLVAAALAALALSTILGGLGIGGIGGGKFKFGKLFGQLSGFGGSSATEFANGGIVSAPTMGLVGEYPGARSNPEVIAPLSKLKGMLGNNNNASNVQVGGSFELRGQDLIVALERANSTRNRMI